MSVGVAFFFVKGFCFGWEREGRFGWMDGWMDG